MPLSTTSAAEYPTTTAPIPSTLAPPPSQPPPSPPNYYETNKILADEQNGFRPNRSCIDHIYCLHNICNVRKKLRQETFLTFIDFQKAFDFVFHPFLYHKLINMGVTGNIYHSIKSLYKSPKSCVILNNELSDWFLVSSGVHQGDSLSPVLFASFINDLALDIKDAGAGVYMGGESKCHYSCMLMILC